MIKAIPELKKIPIMSFSITEETMRVIGVENVHNSYVCWSYFQSLNNKINRQLVDKFKKRFGEYRIIDDPTEASYNSFCIWSDIVKQIKSVDIDKIKTAIKGRKLKAAEGDIAIDQDNNHAFHVFSLLACFVTQHHTAHAVRSIGR